MFFKILLASVLISTLWTRLGKWIHTHFIKTTLGLYETEEVGRKRVGGKIQGTAVIAGGSIGGLWAARFSSAHFEEVIVVEPDTWTLEEEGIAPRWNEAGEAITSEPEPMRSRVFQYLGLHVFQAFHAFVLAKTFPDFELEARKDNIGLVNSFVPIALNGILTSPPTEYYILSKLPRTMATSRAGYERLLRRLVRLNCNNVRWIKGTVAGVIPSANDRQYISAVVINLAEEETTIEQPATLLVDASGSSASGLKWLKDHNYGEKAHKDTDLVFDNFRLSYDPKMRYRCYEWNVPEDIRRRLPSVLDFEDSGMLYVYLPDAAVENRDTGVLRCEGNRIQAVLGGWDVPFSAMPTTPAEFTQWLRSLRGKKPVEAWVYTFFDILNAGNELGPEDVLQYSDYRIPSSVYSQYHRVSDLPCNFVALGDSVMRLNPIWAQGCSKALLGALSLHSVLLTTTVHRREKGSDTLSTNFSKRFFELQAPKISAIWDNTRIPDYGWSTTTPAQGETNSTGWLIRAYANKVMELRHYDRELNHAWFMQLNLFAPGIELFAPRIVLKTLWYTLTSPVIPWAVDEKYELDVKIPVS